MVFYNFSFKNERFILPQTFLKKENGTRPLPYFE